MSFTLKVATLNTWKCDGAYRDRLGWMAEGLAALAPDYILLQEAFTCRSPEADTAQHLADAVGLSAFSLRGREKLRAFEGGKRMSSSDLAILAPTVPTARIELALLGHTLDPERSALILDFNHCGLPLRLVNTHLTHIKGESGSLVRQRQAQQVLEHALSAPSGICITGGDLNAELGTPEVQTLADPPHLTPQDDDRSGTFQGACFRAGNPIPRIDHLFVYKNKDCNAHVTLTSSTVHLNVPIGTQGNFPSDHAAVLVKLSVDTNFS